MASKITLKRLTDLFAKSSIDIEQAGSFLESHTAGVAAEIVGTLVQMEAWGGCPTSISVAEDLPPIGLHRQMLAKESLWGKLVMAVKLPSKRKEVRDKSMLYVWRGEILAPSDAAIYTANFVELLKQARRTHDEYLAAQKKRREEDNARALAQQKDRA